MRIVPIGLALGFVVAATIASNASTPSTMSDDAVAATSTSPALLGSTNAKDEIVIARRGRGADDPAGDDHGRRHGGNNKGDKGRGGHDDGPNHDLNDDHGVHGPNHS